MKTGKTLFYFSIIAIPLLFSKCGDPEVPLVENAKTNIHVKKAYKFNINESIAYSGTLEASETFPLSFSGMGSVKSVLVYEGEIVKKGELLALLNDETYKNAYEMSLAALHQAEDAYGRLRPMYEKGNLPEIKFVEVETGLQQAKAAAAIAKKSLDDCSLYSPVDGIVGKRSIEPGMNVIPGLTAINIVKMEKVFARVPVSENEISFLKKGQSAFINVGALCDREYEGVVEEIGVIADPLAHTYKIKIGIANKDLLIKPGMICDAKIEKPNSFKGVVVANQSVMTDENGKTFLYTVDKIKEKASRKYVTVGRLMKEGMEIIEGLNEGDLVVIAGQQKLVDNSSVNIINQ